MTGKDKDDLKYDGMMINSVNMVLTRKKLNLCYDIKQDYGLFAYCLDIYNAQNKKAAGRIRRLV